jgi:hypothetical protein
MRMIHLGFSHEDWYKIWEGRSGMTTWQIIRWLFEGHFGFNFWIHITRLGGLKNNLHCLSIN